MSDAAQVAKVVKWLKKLDQPQSAWPVFEDGTPLARQAAALLLTLSTSGPAIRLHREGKYAVVSVEGPNGFFEVIRENLSGWPDMTFDHIVNPSGIQAAFEKIKP